MDIKALACGDSRELLRMSFDAMFEPVELLLSDELRSAVSALTISTGASAGGVVTVGA